MEKLLIHYGLLHMINGTSDIGWANEILKKWDKYIFQVPHTPASDPVNGTHTESSDTPIYFECIRLLNRKHFIYVACAYDGYYPNDLNGKLTAIGKYVDFYLSLYERYMVSHLLEGIFFDEFGWDYYPGGSEQNLRDFNNSIINIAHSNNLSAFVNAWFLHQVFIDRVDLNESVWGKSSITDYILSESMFSYGQDRVSYTLAIKSLIKSLGLNGRMFFVQAVDLSSTPVDANTRSLVYSSAVGRMYNYLKIGASLIMDGGVSDIDYGASSNKVLNVDRNLLLEFEVNNDASDVIFTSIPSGYMIENSRYILKLGHDFTIINKIDKL